MTYLWRPVFFLSCSYVCKLVAYDEGCRSRARAGHYLIPIHRLTFSKGFDGFECMARSCSCLPSPSPLSRQSITEVWFKTYRIFTDKPTSQGEAEPMSAAQSPSFSGVCFRSSDAFCNYSNAFIVRARTAKNLDVKLVSFLIHTLLSNRRRLLVNGSILLIKSHHINFLVGAGDSCVVLEAFDGTPIVLFDTSLS